MSVEDRLAITDLLYRYAELIDAGDFDGVGQLLALATFGGTRSRGAGRPATSRRGDISPQTSGAEEIAKLMTTRRFPDFGNTPRTRHLVLNPIVEVNADRTATARSTFCVVHATDTVPLQPIVVGRYFDRFRCDPDVRDGWHFTARRVDVEMVGDVSAHLIFDPGEFDR